MLKLCVIVVLAIIGRVVAYTPAQWASRTIYQVLTDVRFFLCVCLYILEVVWCCVLLAEIAL
jgi:hypothetical protein